MGRTGYRSNCPCYSSRGAAGGIDWAISWGVGTLAGIGGAALFSNPITVAVVLVGVSFGGSEFYNNTASNSVKSTLITGLMMMLPLNKNNNNSTLLLIFI
ncbi:hypothetical protein BSPWISOXPB_9716 [uncultured Gammaproteobacteria bacterium]|nr:hypothetical protein BSPWISOXPB_9716 [uncultured Gammaproteobacteria bacterium]